LGCWLFDRPPSSLPDLSGPGGAGHTGTGGDSSRFGQCPPWRPWRPWRSGRRGPRRQDGQGCGGAMSSRKTSTTVCCATRMHPRMRDKRGQAPPLMMDRLPPTAGKP
jgi:hypothetical protein